MAYFDFVRKIADSWGLPRKLFAETTRAKDGQNIPEKNAANDKARKPLHRQAKTVSSVGRAYMQLAQLDTAILMAEMQDRPDYAPLYRLYKRMMRTDAQIMSGLNTRKNKSAKQKFVIRKNGKINESLHYYFAKTWFTDFIRLAIEGQFYGISLVEFGDMDQNGEFTGINLIPREALIAHRKQMIIVGDDRSESTINYDSSPYNDWLIEVVNKDEPLGWFVIGARFNIIKGYTMTDWLRLAERYGMPTLAVESDSRDDKELDEMELQLSQFGSSGYIILPDGTKVSLLDSSKSDGFNVFLQLINLSDGYISKLMLGQTMTSDDGSSLSQAQVHKEILDEYTEADMRWLTSIVNDLLIPKLILHGYPLEGCKFEYYIFTPEYEAEIAAKSAANNASNAGIGTANNALHEKKKPTTQVVTVDNAATDDLDMQLNTPVIDFGAIIDDVVKDVYDSRVRSGDVAQSVAKETFSQLWKGVIDGYGTAEVDLKGSDKDLAYQLRNNVKVFSVFKSHANIKEMTALLVDADGKKKPWAKFKKEAEGLNGTYNKNWLQTEFNTATSTARMAAKWQDFVRDKDLFPFARYVTVGDSRVRSEHKALDGVVFSIDSPMLNIYWSPNGHGCRCDFEQLADGPETIPATGLPEIPEAFRHNAGKSGKVWKNFGQYEENMPRFKRSALETYADVFMSNVSVTERVKAVTNFAKKYIMGAKFVIKSIKEGYISITSNSQLAHILRRGVAAVLPSGKKEVLTALKAKALLFLPDLIDRASEAITKVNRHDGTAIDYVITDFEGWVTVLIIKRDTTNVPYIYDISFYHKEVFNKANLGK